MLRVKIEMVPFGDESQTKLIEEFKIINTGQHKNSPEYGEYIVHHTNGSFVIDEHIRKFGCFPLIRKILRKYEEP